MGREFAGFVFDSGLVSLYEPYIALQERYAAELLDRVNPYTEMKLTEDPCIAFVELNNENTLLRLRASDVKSLAGTPLADALQDLWQDWLKRRYESLEPLAQSWNRDVIPLGDELLRNRSFGDGLADWALEGSARCPWDLTGLTTRL